jgi:hypothetical protein
MINLNSDLLVLNPLSLAQGEVKRVLRSSTAPNLGTRSGDLSQPDMDAATDEVPPNSMPLLLCDDNTLKTPWIN